MAQKKKKNKSVGRGNTKAKKNTKKANLSSQITENLLQISNGGVEAQNVTNQISNARKFKLSRCQHKNKKKKTNQICKGKSIVKFDQMEIDQAMRIHFQEEIMTDILSRLPVRTLLRFKCVSKFWKSLIVDPYFKRTHYIQSQNSQKLLIAERNLGSDVFNFYSSSLSKYLVEDEQKLYWPLSCKPKNVKLFCSCHGLVLIIVSSAYKHAELWLWNPSTTESIRLPNPEFLEFGIIHCVCGLAYDATCEDFKILTVNLNSSDNFNAPIELLSLKCGSWRRFSYPTGIQRVDGFKDCGMDYLPFLHGAFHWLERCQCFLQVLCAKVEVHKSAVDSISQLILGICCNTDGASYGNSGSSSVGICLELRRSCNDTVRVTNVKFHLAVVSFVLLWRSTKQPSRWTPTILHIM